MPELARRRMAEGVGFEPTREREPPGGFQDRCLKPLGHPSCIGCSYTFASLASAACGDYHGIATGCPKKEGGTFAARSRHRCGSRQAGLVNADSWGQPVVVENRPGAAHLHRQLARQDVGSAGSTERYDQAYRSRGVGFLAIRDETGSTAVLGADCRNFLREKCMMVSLQCMMVSLQ